MKSDFINDRCTAADCRMLFKSSVRELNWLCYTLTRDEALTQKALDAALEQSLKGATQVFREWMLGWARRLIIKFCIATMRPGESPLAGSAYPLFPMNFGSMNSDHVGELLRLPPASLQKRLFRLDLLSRFVFVLRAVEGYSRHETALLLDIDDRACEWVYVWAIGTLGSDTQRLESDEFDGAMLTGSVDEQTYSSELMEMA